MSILNDIKQFRDLLIIRDNKSRVFHKGYTSGLIVFQ